ncbi:RS8 protein, partial [Acromyrmex insinuator]
MGISRDHWHKRRATGGKRKPIRKKRKFELGRPAANTKLGPQRIHTVRTRGGNKKYRALRLDAGNFSWGSECSTRKTRIIDVVYNASNNELVRTKTLVKNAIVTIDATPFRQWYEGHYVLPLGRKRGAKLTEAEEEVLNKKRSKKAESKYKARQRFAKVEPALEEQFATGRVLGWLLNNLSTTYRYASCLNFYPLISFLQARNYAARKGTREKARKKKVKKVIEKVGFIPHDQRVKTTGVKTLELKDISPDDSKKSEPIDNVWISKYHKWKIYSFEEAVQNHRETHHPTIYNLPNESIKAFLELDMQGAKKTKFVDPFTRIVCLPHVFDHGQTRKLLVFCKSLEMEEIARGAGADYVGGKQLIKQIQNGQFSMKEYDIILSEPTILPDLLLIRGLMRKKFPSAKSGTLGTDLKTMVTKFLTGMRYTGKPHETLKSFGTVDVAFGTLDMDTKQLEENFATIIKDVNKVRPRRPGPFITRARITCSPSSEKFKVDFEQYLSKDKVTLEAEEEAEEAKQDVVIASH